MRKMRIKAYLTTPLLSVVWVLCLSIMQIPGFKENWPEKKQNAPCRVPSYWPTDGSWVRVGDFAFTATRLLLSELKEYWLAVQVISLQYTSSSKNHCTICSTSPSKTFAPHPCSLALLTSSHTVVFPYPDFNPLYFLIVHPISQLNCLFLSSQSHSEGVRANWPSCNTVSVFSKI